MFTTGRIVFTLFFLVLFIASLIYAYRKDLQTNRIHFPKSYRIIIVIMLIFSCLFLIIKIKSWFFK